MMLYAPQESSILRFDVDFALAPFANISFFDAPARNIVFHFSLRSDTNQVACNTRRGEDWGGEVTKDVSLTPKLEVELRFERKGLRVFAGGALLFDFTGPLARQRFRKWGGIEHIDFQGAVLASTLRQTGRDLIAGGEGLRLNDRLVLEESGDLFQSTSALLVNSVAYPAQKTRSISGEPLLRAIVPGRAWIDPESNESYEEIEIGFDSTPKTLSITRSQLAVTLDGLLVRFDPRVDAFGFIQLLEHAHYAKIDRLLSGPAQQVLAQGARFYRLDRLAEWGVSLPAEVTRSPASQGFDLRLGTLLARFYQLTERAPDIDPLQHLQSLLPEDEDLLQDFLLSLTDYFCRKSVEDSGFFKLAARYFPDAMTGKGDVWFDSAILPFVVMRGDHEDAVDLLQELVSAKGGWLVTPVVGWLMRRVCDAELVPEPWRSDYVRQIAALIKARQDHYFERHFCTEITSGMAALVAAQVSFSEPIAQDIERMAIRAFALSPSFWRALDGASLVPQMQLISETCEKVFSAIDTGQNVPDGPLDILIQSGCLDASRFRRETWQIQDVLSDLDKGQNLSGQDTSEAALRLLAHPHGHSDSKLVHSHARRALWRMSSDFKQARYSSAQRKLGTVAAEFEKEQTQEAFEALCLALAPLRNENVNFLGCTVATAVASLLRARSAAVGMIARLEELAEPERSDPDDSVSDTLLERAIVRGAYLPDIRQPHSAVYDTIVVVMSCHPNLPKRVAQMRRGWLSDLAALGIPYVVVVGAKEEAELESKAFRSGDVVHLPVSDTYEGLPAKTLAAIDWIYENTGHAHMLKVDDDCFVNSEVFFKSLSYRKADYYGRKLERMQGQVDRGWHFGKSTSLDARQTLDKSPEPSVYADGGTGWTISRHAMETAREMALSAQGQELIQTSFMEDKLLGDLLRLGGIELCDEDYLVTIRRRAHSDAIPVARWAAGFDASKVSDVKITHLDAAEPQALASKRLAENVLRPAKIWPSFQQPRLGYQSNALELVSDVSSLRLAVDAEVAVVAVMRNEMFMLPRFLEHYRKLGVGAFIFADNFSDDGTLEYLAQQPDVTLFSVDTDYGQSKYGVAWQQALLSEFRLGKWTVVADVDEFLVWQEEQTETLAELISTDDFQEADAARVFMLDMYPRGELSTADFKVDSPFEQAPFCDREPFLEHWPGRGPYTDASMYNSALRHRLVAGSRPDLFVAQKLALLKYKPWMRLSAGLHFVAEAKLAKRELFFGHFKYNAEFLRKAEVEVSRGQHFNNAEEYQNYLRICTGGRAVIYDPSVSIRWSESPFVKDRIKGSGRSN